MRTNEVSVAISSLKPKLLHRFTPRNDKLLNAFVLAEKISENRKWSNRPSRCNIGTLFLLRSRRNTERVRFELTIDLRQCRFSRPVPSTARPPLPARFAIGRTGEVSPNRSAKGKRYGRIPIHSTGYSGFKWARSRPVSTTKWAERADPNPKYFLMRSRPITFR